MERVLEEVSFLGSDLPELRVVVDASFVRDKLADIAKDADLSRFIL
jgi:ATP-dependent HslUV protease ATP-binding subunit HslU